MVKYGLHIWAKSSKMERLYRHRVGEKVTSSMHWYLMYNGAFHDDKFRYILRAFAFTMDREMSSEYCILCG